jgi:uncharacterized protein (TIGR02996 family)
MTEADWQALLDRSPADAELRLQYSDWLEEQDLLTEAEVQRWLARAGRRPNATAIDWEWWREGTVLPLPGSFSFTPGPPAPQPDSSHRYLPPALFVYLPGPDRPYQAYGSRREAEAALAVAWARLKEAGGPLP